MAEYKHIMRMTVLFPMGKGVIYTNMGVGHFLSSALMHFEI